MTPVEKAFEYILKMQENAERDGLLNRSGFRPRVPEWKIPSRAPSPEPSQKMDWSMLHQDRCPKCGSDLSSNSRGIICSVDGCNFFIRKERLDQLRGHMKPATTERESDVRIVTIDEDKPIARGYRQMQGKLLI
jgi:hypothetical protein